MAPKHPCIVCQKNVTSNSIACSVCSRWCHAPCSDLDPQVLKYFETQQATTGTHSWSCTGCNIAYTKLNTRIRQLENKLEEQEKALKENKEETTKNTDRLDEVEKEMTEMKKEAKKDRDELIKKTTSHWSKEMMEREARKSNLVIYGLPEPAANIKAGHERQRMDKETVGDLFEALQVNVRNDDVKFAARVGKITEAVSTNPRPLKMSFRNTGTREEIFANAKLLPRTEFHAVSIVPDLTEMQRQDDKDLFKEAERLNQEMSAEDSGNFFYRCIGRRGERTIVRLKKTDNGGNRINGGSRTNGGDRTNRANMATGANRVSRGRVRESIYQTTTDREEEEMEDTDSNGKRGRQEESDDSVLESPNGSQTRQPPKKASKGRNN